MDRNTEDLPPPTQPNNESFQRPEKNKSNDAPPLPPSLVEDEKAKAKFELSQGRRAEQGSKSNHSTTTAGSESVKSSTRNLEQRRLDKFRTDAEETSRPGASSSSSAGSSFDDRLARKMAGEDKAGSTASQRFNDRLKSKMSAEEASRPGASSQATQLKDVRQDGSNRYSSSEGVEQCSDIDSGPISIAATLDDGDQKRLNKLQTSHSSVSSKGSQRLTDGELSSNQTSLSSESTRHRRSLERCADGDSGPADLPVNNSKRSLSTVMQSRRSLERCTDGDAGPSSAGAYTDPAAEKLNHHSFASPPFAGGGINSLLSNDSIGQDLGADSVVSTGCDDEREGNDVSVATGQGTSDDIEAGQMQTAEITAEVQATTAGDGVAPLDAFLVGEGEGRRGDGFVLGIEAKPSKYEVAQSRGSMFVARLFSPFAPVLPWYRNRRIQALIFFALLVVSGAIAASVILVTQEGNTITQIEIIRGDPRVITNITYVQNDTVIVQTEIINRVVIASSAPSASLNPSASPMTSKQTASTLPEEELTKPVDTEGSGGLFQGGTGGLISEASEEQIDATPTFKYIGEGRCVDEESNDYDSIRYSPVSSASKCEKKCVSLDTNSVALVGFGYWNWGSSRQCFCLIEDGFVTSDNPGSIEDKCPPDADVCVCTAGGSGVVASSNKIGNYECYRNPNFTAQVCPHKYDFEFQHPRN